MYIDHCGVILVVMFTQTVKLLNNFCFQSASKTAADSCRTERQIQRDTRGSTYAAQFAQQRLHANCPKMTEKEQWPLAT